jgi:hypothetical protein
MLKFSIEPSEVTKHSEPFSTMFLMIKAGISEVENMTHEVRILYTNIIEERTIHDCKWDCRVIMDFNTTFNCKCVKQRSQLKVVNLY